MRIPKAAAFIRMGTALNRWLGLGLGLLGILTGTSGFAAAPVLEHVFPVALAVGSSNSVTLVGKFDPWPPRVWLDGTGVALEPTTNNGVVTVVVATNAPVGPRLVRTFNGEGASAPHFLLVTAEPELSEVEPNNERAAPQAIERLPAVLNGRLEKNGDVDSFAVTLEAGQTLVAWLECYTLMSPLDPVLRLIDSRGVQVAWNHDDGRSLDPFLTWTAPTAGTWVLQTFGFAYPAGSEIRFSGNERGVYRLHLTSGPVVRHTLPLGVGRGGSTTLRLRGWNLGAETNREVVFDGGTVGAEVLNVSFRPTGIDDPIELAVGDGPETMEIEPNTASAEANPLEVPGAVSGELNQPGDEDRFLFPAKKGELLLLEIHSASLGFPLDAWLKVEDRSGKELVRNDDGAGADPLLEWTAEEDGSYVAAVGNLLRRGGADQWYRLGIRRAKPSVQVSVTENAWAVEPGKTNEIKVAVARRHGFDAKLQLSVSGLPEGVQAEPVEVSDKGGETVLKIIAGEGAQPFSGPIRIVATEGESGREQGASMSLVSAGENNGVPQGYRRLVIDSVSALWLTVLPTPKVEKK